MIHSEASKLLALCASYDQRTVGASDVEAWMLAIGDLNASDCASAIAAYYRNLSDPRANRIGVGQVFAGVKRIRADRLERAPIAQPPPDLDPDDVAAYLRWHAGWIRSAGDDQPERPAVAS